MRRAAIFYHHPQCSIQSAHGIIQSLSSSFEIDCINNTQLNNLNRYDLLALPGGLGDSDSFYKILHSQKHIIQDFAKTRKVLGICMGAYWCGPLYLNLIDSNPVQYIKRNNSEIKRSYGTKAKVIWNNSEEIMYFYDGCTFTNTENAEIIARYANDDPAAIIEKNVLAIGPHPESDQYWYKGSNVRYWHDRRHHKLLEQAVETLFARE